MKFVSIPDELVTAVNAANKLLPNTEDICVSFVKDDALTLNMVDGVVQIGYSRKCEALRGMSMAKRFSADPTPIRQTAKFDTLTFMADCSRNAVLNVSSVKELIVYLAMMGFNCLMLYTEDTYEIPEEPYFGHLRGRYSVSEMQELYAYGEEIGVNLIPCIQTLAHLHNIFNWKRFDDVHDIDDILLADDQQTYELIENMIKTVRSFTSCKYINIGMDEAHNLGRGRYLDMNGLKSSSDIMLKHLDKVVKLCRKYDFTPIMWSDMFFHMQFNVDYYVGEGELSQEVIDKIPDAVSLCYWDYYNTPALSNVIEHMFKQHARTGKEIWFAGGSWSWSGATPKNYFSNSVTPNQLEIGLRYGVKNVIATGWGDDGAECTNWNTLPSMLQYAEVCYGDASEGTLDKRSMDCFELHYADFLKIDQLGKPDILDPYRRNPPCLEKIALYNDVLMGILDANLPENIAQRFARDAEILRGVPANRFDFLFDTQRALADVTAMKADLSIRIKKAYRNGDKEALQNIVEKDFPAVCEALECLSDTYRRQWFKVNKPFGYEVIDVRFGGLKERMQTAKLRITAYLDGSVDSLEELEQEDLTFGLREMERTDRMNNWRRCVTACRLVY